MALVKIKAGVTPRSLIILAAVANVAQTLSEPEVVVITSGTDGKHRKGSKHYSGEALDIRTSNFRGPAQVEEFIARLKARLGPGYDLVLEPDHLHCEWDPSSARTSQRVQRPFAPSVHEPALFINTEQPPTR